MAIDWDDIENEMGGKFKNYASDGKYKVKCVGVEVKEVGSNGSVVEKFQFEETNDTVYPTADHWIAKNNDKFRAYHQKNLLVMLGASEANARTAVEKAEAKDFAYAVKFYEDAFNKLLAKKPEVEIEVYTDGKYARAEFTDRKVAMPHDGDKKEDKDEITLDADDIDISDIPF